MKSDNILSWELVE